MSVTPPATPTSEVKFWVICQADHPLSYQLAREINDWQIAGVQAKVDHRVSLAVGDAISQADFAVFVTAGTGEGEYVSVTPISSTATSALSKAVQSPISFLNTLRKRHGRVPQSWWFQLPVTDTHQGSSTIPPEYILSKAVSKIEIFMRNHYLRHQAFQAAQQSATASVQPVSIAA